MKRRFEEHKKEHEEVKKIINALDLSRTMC